MKIGQDLEDLANITAVGEVFSDHRGIDTYNELCSGILPDEDSLCEDYEHYDDVEDVLELVNSYARSFKRFANEVIE